MIEYRGERFEGYNIPKRTPGHATKSHAVLVKEGDRIELIRFGSQGVSGSPPKEGESESYSSRRINWIRRHWEDIKRGKFSAAWHAARVKWGYTYKEGNKMP